MIQSTIYFTSYAKKQLYQALFNFVGRRFYSIVHVIYDEYFIPSVKSKWSLWKLSLIISLVIGNAYQYFHLELYQIQLYETPPLNFYLYALQLVLGCGFPCHITLILVHNLYGKLYYYTRLYMRRILLDMNL